MNTPDLLTNENKFNLLTGRIPLLLNRFLSQKLKSEKIDLTREQWSVLAVLWKTDGCSQQIIADATNRDKPGITRLIDNLAKEGYVIRKNDEKDRRLNLIFLTSKGKKIKEPVMKVVDETIEQATKGLNDDQIIVIRNAFQVIYENIINYVK